MDIVHAQETAMTRTLSTLFAALLLTGATVAQAQQTPPPAGEGKAKPRPEMRDCSKAPDPKACEERRQKIRAAKDEARKACEGKQGAERRECMTRSTCAKAPDPAKCEARAKERGERKKQQMEQRKSGAADAKKS